MTEVEHLAIIITNAYDFAKINRQSNRAHTIAALHCIQAGYGNIEKALTEFAKKLKEELDERIYSATLEGIAEAREAVDETLKEFLKQ